MDDELRAFKTEIDLRDYVCSVGYEVDRTKSTRHETYMRCHADKINVHLGSNGDWTWYSFHDGLSGTIVDFVQSRQGIRNLGRVRQILRPWVGREPSPRLPPQPTSAPPKDRAHVRAQCCSMPVARVHSYLEAKRHIPAALLACDRFAGRVRIDRYGNAIFPHYDRGGICGFEIRGPKFKGFSPGGTKGLWCSHVRPDDHVLVLCESAINVLSYATLFPNDLARYASIAGRASDGQQKLIRAAIERMSAGSEIVSAMDADDAGRTHSCLVRAIFSSVGRADLVFRNHYPDHRNDWNEVLRETL